MELQVVVETLETLGVGHDSASVYALMLLNPGIDLPELVTSTELAESTLRAIFDELADLAFMRPSLADPNAPRVVRPEVAVDLLLRRQEREFSRRTAELAESKAVAARMMAAVGESAFNASSECERLGGIDMIMARLEMLAATVQHEVLSVLPGGAQSQESLDAALPLDAAALRRGVRLPTLYQESIRNDPPTYSYAKWLSSHGAEVRLARIPPPRMVIFDRQFAMLPINPEDTRAGAICMREPAVIATMTQVWTQSWEAASLLSTRVPGEDSELSPNERTLLTLLSRGMTDEAAAKRLGIGLRTVRRQMSKIMEQLGASSRFEAGMKAARRGWIAP